MFVFVIRPPRGDARRLVLRAALVVTLTLLSTATSSSGMILRSGPSAVLPDHTGFHPAGASPAAGWFSSSGALSPSGLVVNRTLVLFNGSTFYGNFVSYPAQYPQAIAPDPSDGSVWVPGAPIGQIQGYDAATAEVNASTGQVILTAPAPTSQGYTLAMFDPVHHLLFLSGNGLNVTEWNASNGQLVQSTPLVNPSSLALDPNTGQVYAVQGSDVDVLNVSSNAIVAKVGVANQPGALEFDPLDNAMVATNDGPVGCCLGTSYLSFINDTNYTWFDSNIPNIASGYHADPGNIAFDPINETLVVPFAYGENLGVFNATNGTLVSSVLASGPANSPLTVTYDPGDQEFWVQLINGSTKLFTLNLSAAGFVPGGYYGRFAYDLGTNEMLAANSGAWAGGGVDVFNATTAALSAVWNLSGPAPLGTVFAGPNDTLFVEGYGQRGIWTVNTSTDSVGPTLASPYTGGPWASVAADGSVFVSETNNGSVERWNSSAPYALLDAARTNPLPSRTSFPEGLAFDSGHGRLLVADYGTNNLSLLDPLHLTTQTTIGVGTGPTAVVDVAPIGEYFVVDNGGNAVTVLNASTLAIVRTVLLANGPTGGAYDPSAGVVLVTENGGSAVAAIPTAAGGRPYLIGTGVAPSGIAYDAVSNAVVIANSGSANLTVLNGTSLAHVSDLAVGLDPRTISVDPATGALAVANFQSDSISLVTGCLRPSCLSIGRFGASPPEIDEGNATTISVEVHGAVGNLSFRYTGLPSGCASQDVASFRCVPTESGRFSITVAATDSTGTVATANLSLSVLPPPFPDVNAFTVLPSQVVVGDWITLNLSVVGGSLPYSFAYVGLPPGCLSANASVWRCQVTAAGNFTVEAVVRDSRGAAAFANATLEVTFGPAPEIQTLTATPTPIVVNQTATFAVSLTGGWGWATESWPSLPSGCASENVTVLPCTPSAAGSFTLTVDVTDGAGRSAQSSRQLVVLPESPTVLSIVATPAVPRVGENLTVSVGLAGGELPETTTVSGLPPGCPVATAPPVTCVPTAAGDFTVSAVVIDAAAREANRTITIDVLPAIPAPRVTAFEAAPDPVPLGDSLTLSVTTVDGVSPLTYAYSGLPTGCSGADAPTFSCVPTVTGFFNVSVTVTDGDNHSGHASTLIQVAAAGPPGPAGNANAPVGALWLGIAVVTVGVSAAVGVLLLRHRGRRPPGEPSEKPEPPQSEESVDQDGPPSEGTI